MRSFRPTTWLLIGFLLALASCSAFADTIPSTKVASTTLWNPDVCTGAPYSATASTVSELHSLYLQNWTVPCSDGVVRQVTSDLSVYNEETGGYFKVNYSVPGQNFVSGELAVHVTYSCPTDYTISADGLSCSRPDCPAGTEHNSAGDCVTPCPAAGAKTHYGEMAYFSKSASGADRACINGCSYGWGSVSASCIDNYCGRVIGYSSGMSCGSTSIIPVEIVSQPVDPTDPAQPVENNPDAPGTGEAQQSDPPETTEEQCTAKGMGYVTMNGVTVCVPAGTGQEEVTNSGQQETINPDGTKTKTETTTTTNPDDSINESQTETTTDANGNVTGTATTTKTYSSPQDYCRANPSAEMCQKTTASGGATCEAPPICKGDAAACAILRQQWEARCEIKKQNDFVGAPGDPGEFESKTTAIDAKKTELGNLIDQIRGEAAGLFTFSGAGTATLGCDAGVTTTQGFHVELCFSKYDDELQMIGAVLVFVSLVIAVFIMFS